MLTFVLPKIGPLHPTILLLPCRCPTQSRGAGREYTEKDLTEFIVGAVSEMDSPKKPNAEAKELDRRYFCGITDAMLAADRKAMCSVTAETIRAQAADLADRMANATRVTFGSKDAVEAGKQLFDRIETL